MFSKKSEVFKKVQVLAALKLFGLALTLSGCGNYEEFKEDPSNLFTRVAPSQSVTFNQVNEQVLTPRCIQCHPGYDDYNTVSANLQKIAGSIASDRMPQNGPLEPELKNLILGWIAAGAPQGNVAPIKPDPADDTLNATYNSIAKNLFGKKCVVCHNPQGQVPFLSLASREAIWEQRDYLLDFEKPEDSYILEVIQDPSEPMPPLESPFEQVTEEEINILKEWIGKGMP